ALDGELDLPGLSHGLEDQRVGAALRERLGLLAEGRAHPRALLLGGAGERKTRRADRAPDVGAIARGLAGEADRGDVELAHALLEPLAGEANAVAAERVGLEELGPGAEVILVDFEHELG